MLLVRSTWRHTGWTACVACLLAIAGADPRADPNATGANLDTNATSANFDKNTTSDNVANSTLNGTIREDSSVEGAETWTDKMLTDDIFNVISVIVGLCVILVGRLLPTLGGGSLVLALFFAVLMKSGQQNDPDLSQWPWWPFVILLLTMLSMGMLILFLRRTVTAVVTGVVLAVAALSVTLVAALQFLPAGLISTLFCFVLGCMAGWLLTNPETSESERYTRYAAVQKWFYIGLSALIGAFLLVDGCAYFISGSDLLRDIVRSVLAEENAVDKEKLAQDAKQVAITWLSLSAVLPPARPVVGVLYERYKPSMCQKDYYNPAKETSLTTPPSVLGNDAQI